MTPFFLTLNYFFMTEFSCKGKTIRQIRSEIEKYVLTKGSIYEVVRLEYWNGNTRTDTIEEIDHELTMMLREEVSM